MGLEEQQSARQPFSKTRDLFSDRPASGPSTPAPNFVSGSSHFNVETNTQFHDFYCGDPHKMVQAKDVVLQEDRHDPTSRGMGSRSAPGLVATVIRPAKYDCLEDFFSPLKFLLLCLFASNMKLESILFIALFLTTNQLRSTFASPMVSGDTVADSPLHNSTNSVATQADLIPNYQRYLRCGHWRPRSV